ncbi:four helix bundle protein [Candidatus Sulfidibacterium hydrothermale]|uniref:four helix bundle protein n=1 Tax=Candidatus Sulfidibacterium hydrothermale TaxID=2875962 RepID=UPI001F0B4630|nr:four helix bundle protein [Candidatus Sulfidibacterium hydrothermale]UBM61261.1 four helix bundle protein [Candidatus Sulfidibacterium hydrothermale]
MDKNELIERNKRFAIKCVQLAESLPNTKLGNHIRDQLIRCSTSIAANYRASKLAQSRAAFIAKLSIVIEEADEAEFWIDLGCEFDLFEHTKAKELIKEAHELASIYIATRNTLRNKK